MLFPVIFFVRFKNKKSIAFFQLTILKVRMMHAGCVGEMESGRGELSRDEDGEPLVLLSSCEKFGEDVKL